MEPLIQQLKSLPAKWQSFSRATRMLLIGTLVALGSVALVSYLLSGAADPYQYAFTNLSPEDGQAASAVLKTSGIPFRSEAGGSALAVPASKVYDARLILAAQGLPRASGIGFEIFDKGQFGVSEFTQRVNLRRAIEGELARTVGSLDEVRSARVHLSLGERGLYRGEDKKATASVVVTLHPGRTLSDSQLSGIRHLVAAAVPGLQPDGVTIVDGHGAVLGGAPGEATNGKSFEQNTEAELQSRIVTLLEPVVGAGAVVARVAVTVDNSEVSQSSEVFDPDQAALRTEKKSNQNQSSDNGTQTGVAGAQANQPMVLAQGTYLPNGNGTGSSSKSQSASGDELRTWEISKTTTTSVIKQPRLRKLSVAVLLDQPKDAPRSEAELNRLGELVKRAVGFDDQRGDQFQISSATFTKADSGAEAIAPDGPPKFPWWAPYAAGVFAFIVIMAVVAISLRKKKPALAPMVLKPGMKVSELEAQNAQATALANAPAGTGAAAAPGTKPAKTVDVVTPALPPEPSVKEKAMAHAMKDPVKTAQLIRAWIAADLEAAKEARRG
ncbi:MAG: flagellar M-ring protein FliF [Myxococcaceae bacterium]|nr:flagellar M-ring protein FliF [Myxococcaceae bacterium]